LSKNKVIYATEEENTMKVTYDMNAALYYAVSKLGEDNGNSEKAIKAVQAQLKKIEMSAMKREDTSLLQLLSDSVFVEGSEEGCD